MSGANKAETVYMGYNTVVSKQIDIDNKFSNFNTLLESWAILKNE